MTSGEAMGLLVLDATGNLKVDKVGARSWGAGAGVRTCLLLLGPAALGVGIVGGTAAGGLHHKGLQLSDQDKARIAADLSAGKAAIGVLAKVEDTSGLEAELTHWVASPRVMRWSTRQRFRQQRRSSPASARCLVARRVQLPGTGEAQRRDR